MEPANGITIVSGQDGNGGSLTWVRCILTAMIPKSRGDSHGTGKSRYVRVLAFGQRPEREILPDHRTVRGLKGPALCNDKDSIAMSRSNGEHASGKVYRGGVTR